MAILTPGNNITPASGNHGNSYGYALTALAVLYFMMGFITCLNDTLVPFFKTGFSLSYAQSSLVQFYFFLTYAIMSIPAGKIVGKIGYKRGMVLGFGIAGFGALLFLPASWFHHYSLFLSALFVLAIGIVLLQVAANPYITLLGKPETASSRLAMIQGVGSLGTTVAPLFGARFILAKTAEADASSGALSVPYVGIGMVLFAIALVVSRLALPNMHSADFTSLSSVGGEKTSIFAFRNLNFGIVAIFMYVGAEVAIGTFLTNYVADTLAIEEHRANNFVALYWGGMLVGRLAGSFVLRRSKPQHVLLGSAMLAIVCIVTSLAASGHVAVWSMVAVGLCNSIMFAVIFSLSISGLGVHTARASGLLSSAIVGGAVIPYLQGVLIDRYDWVFAFLLPLLCYSCLVFYGAYWYRLRRST